MQDDTEINWNTLVDPACNWTGRDLRRRWNALKGKAEDSGNKTHTGKALCMLHQWQHWSTYRDHGYSPSYIPCQPVICLFSLNNAIGPPVIATKVKYVYCMKWPKSFLRILLHMLLRIPRVHLDNLMPLSLHILLLSICACICLSITDPIGSRVVGSTGLREVFG